jgi:hypothetical protein
VRPALPTGLALLILATSCVTINGKSYSANTLFVSEVRYQPRQSSQNLCVVVKDSKATPIPGAKVRVVQEPAGGIDAGVTDTGGVVFFSLGTDTWQVSVWFPGYNRGSCTVQIGTRQTCFLTFYLRSRDGIDPGLFFCRLENDAETTSP